MLLGCMVCKWVATCGHRLQSPDATQVPAKARLTTNALATEQGSSTKPTTARCAYHLPRGTVQPGMSHTKTINPSRRFDWAGMPMSGRGTAREPWARPFPVPRGRAEPNSSIKGAMSEAFVPFGQWRAKRRPCHNIMSQ